MAEGSTNMIKLCALWDGKTAAGGPKMSGNLADAHMMVLPNAKKEPGTKQPDYYVYLVPRHMRGGSRDKSEGYDTSPAATGGDPF